MQRRDVLLCRISAPGTMRHRYPQAGREPRPRAGLVAGAGRPAVCHRFRWRAAACPYGCAAFRRRRQSGLLSTGEPDFRFSVFPAPQAAVRRSALAGARAMTACSRPSKRTRPKDDPVSATKTRDAQPVPPLAMTGPGKTAVEPVPEIFGKSAAWTIRSRRARSTAWKTRSCASMRAAMSAGCSPARRCSTTSSSMARLGDRAQALRARDPGSADARRSFRCAATRRSISTAAWRHGQRRSDGRGRGGERCSAVRSASCDGATDRAGSAARQRTARHGEQHPRMARRRPRGFPQRNRSGRAACRASADW